MPLTKEQKKQVVCDLKDKLLKHKSAVFMDYRGVSVKDMTSLRQELKKENIELRVAKKTLIDLALGEAGLKNVSVDNMNGQVAVIFGYDDEVGPAKILSKFIKNKKSGQFLGGILSNYFIDETRVADLARLPLKQELLAQVVGTINAPLNSFVRVLSGNLAGLLTALSGIKK